jgi:hypothetical protein
VAVEADQRLVADGQEAADRAGDRKSGHEQQQDGEAGDHLRHEDPPR